MAEDLDLFSPAEMGGRPAAGSAPPPLAERMRPRTLDEFAGQEHLLGPGKFLRRMLERREVFSLILWGPPGSGKTTLARLVAEATGHRFASFSAVLSGVKEIRAVIDEARRERGRGRRTILFVDEIHRFNKAQQDAFLPHVEDGTIVLVGATTENPSFEVISPLLSRAKVLVLERLSEGHLRAILERALADPDRGFGGRGIDIAPEAMEALCAAADGDARRALNTLEAAAAIAPRPPGTAGSVTGCVRISREVVLEAHQKKALLYDRAGEEHYNLVSAFIKSLRGSDPDAALYWMARMLEAGEDPLFVVRRMVIFAAEDIGNADPRALSVALAAKAAFEFVGPPEGRIPLAQAVTYLATAPKSNASYVALNRALEDAAAGGTLPVPPHLRNAPTRLMKEIGYGKGYQYPHDHEGHFVVEEYLPEALRGRRYYEPTEIGYERQIRVLMGEREKRKRLARAAGPDAGPSEPETEPPVGGPGDAGVGEASRQTTPSKGRRDPGRA